MDEKPNKTKRTVKIKLVDSGNIMSERSNVIGTNKTYLKRKINQTEGTASLDNTNSNKNVEKSPKKVKYEKFESDTNVEEEYLETIVNNESNLLEKKNEEEDKEDVVVEVIEGSNKKKIVLPNKSDSCKTFGIDWNKYFTNQNISLEKDLKKKKKKKKTSTSLDTPSTSRTNFNTTKSSETLDDIPLTVLEINEGNTQDELKQEIKKEIITDKYIPPSNPPKIPNLKRNRNYGLKKDSSKNKPKYDLANTFKNDDLNQIQIKIETVQSPQNKTNKEMTLVKFFAEQKLTYRVMKRVNFILKMVKHEKIIVNFIKLMKAIREEEAKEGYTVGIDKKSIQRLVLKLSEYGLLKYQKATLTSDTTEKKVTFICDVNIEDEHSIINAVLEQSKMKFFIMAKPADKTEPKTKEVQDEKLEERLETINAEKLCLNKKETDYEYKYNRIMAKKYGYRPKFSRSRIMHELLFYIIFDNKSEPITDIEELDKIFQEYGGTYQLFENCNISPVYNRDVSWKTFISPLPDYTNLPRGWIVLSDIFLRLPLFILASCFNITYEIPLLEEFLAHPVRKYCLIKDLPPIIRNGITYGKKLSYTLMENLKNLCVLGLVQLGPQILKDKDQLFIYINRKASLYNTMSSSPGYIYVSDEIEYDKVSYTFNKFQDVEQYWYDMWSICIHTPLGYRSSVAGEYVVLESAWTKPELADCLKPHLPEEVEGLDTGEIPGDKKGAGGFDSSLYAHMKRNWNWLHSISCNSEKQSINAPKKDKSNKKSPNIKVVPTNKNKIPNNETKVKPKRFKVRVLQKKTKIRLVVDRKHKKPKYEYDEKDKLCLKNMRRLRTDWSAVEDHVVLLCSIASSFLCPNYRRQNINPTVFRDVLHKMVPHANDKTSKSVQRRVRYMLKNVKTRKSVFMCLEEIKHCEHIIEKFETLTKQFQNLAIPELTLKIAFTELVAFLNHKFVNNIPKKNMSPINIPNTITQLKAHYDIITGNKKNVTLIKDVENVRDIECDTVRSVIHSSLCSTKDKTSWAYQLFKIYQQYPETLLRQVISKIRLDKMATMKKSALLKIRSTNTSSILQSPFKLSMYYKHQLQNVKFTYKMLSEANTFILNFMNWFYSANKDDIFDITFSDHGASLIIETILRKLQLEIIFEHPDQVIILDPVLKEDQTYERILNKYYNILKEQTGINLKEHRASSDSDEENIPHVEEQIIDSEIKNASRIGFHMMRADIFDKNDKNIQHMHDYFVVQASKMYLKPLESNNITSYDNNNKKIMKKVIDDIKNQFTYPDSCSKIISENIKSHFSDLNLTSYDFEYIEKLKCHIYEAKELGLTTDELKNIEKDSECCNLTLKNALEILITLHIILKVGTVTLRYVHFDYKKPWLTHADKIMRLEKEKMTRDLLTSKWKGKKIIKIDEHKKDHKLKILIAPWVRLDGSLNKRVLDRWLGTLISFCVEEPGMMLQDLITKIEFLKPTETIFLVEQLVNIDCVKLIKVIKPKVNLFSDIIDYDFIESNTLDDPKEIIIEPTEDVFLNFAVFVGNKTYNINFID